MIPFIIIMLYLAVLLFISYLSSRKLKKGDGSENFLLAGKNLNWPLVGVVIAGLGLGGASTVGVAESAYTAGLSAGWYDAAWAIGAAVVAVFMAAKIRRSRIATVIETIEISYGKVSGFVVMLLQMIVGFGIFTMQISAGGALLASILPNVFTVTGGTILTDAIFCVIAIIGGMWSAALSNIINVIVIFVGMIIGAFAVVGHFDGFAAINATLPATVNNIWWSFFNGYGPAKVVGQIISMIVLAICIQTCTQTAASARSEKDARGGFWFAALLMAPVGFISALLGVVAASKLPNLESAAMALPIIITRINPWISGIVLSGLWAASVSTGQGMLIGQSTMITQDIVVKYFAPDLGDKAKLLVSRVAMLVLCILGIYFGLRMNGIVATLMKLLTLWTPLAVVVLITWACPKYTRKNTGAIVLIAGGIWGVLALFIPGMVIAGQAIFGTTIVSIAAWIVSLLIDKTPSNANALYRKD